MKPQFPDEQSGGGEFVRQEDAFREWITSGPAAKFFDRAIGVTVLDPIRDERGWAFRDGPGYSTDPVNGFQFLSQAYKVTDPTYIGRVTVPVLWDKESRVIVNNSEDDICRMFHDAFRAYGDSSVNLFPAEISNEQERLSSFVYEHINNRVYQAGFATTQKVYENAVRNLFSALDQLDQKLTASRYLFGARPVETDWRLFCTLIRFDAVYHGHFKCNLRRMVDYPNLDGYLRDLYQQPGIRDTVNFDHIKRHYYMTHEEINPTRIVPLGPILDLDRPHDRDRFP
jgi:putative glutathione S-transferase